MMKALLPIMLMTLAAASPDTAAKAAIGRAMADSAHGWNGGNLGRFVSIYADDAIYATKAGLVRGKRAIAARYAKNFTAGGNARGTLSFAPLAWRVVDPRHELLVARWTLTPGGGKPADTGLTTLLFENHGGHWLIVSDHSS